MPQAHLIQNSFNSGEISPLAAGRSDTTPYRHALLSCRNMVPTTVGPVVKRAGSRYITTVADESHNSRLIPFIFSNLQSYVFEFGEGIIRFFTPSASGGWVIPPSNDFDDSRVDTTNETVGLTGPHYYRDGSGPYRVWSDGTLPTGWDDTTDYYIVLAAASAGPASFGLSTTPGGAVVSISDGGTLAAGEYHHIAPDASVIQAVDAPYTIDEVWELDFCQSGDVLYITHENHPPMQLERWAADSFRIIPVFFKDGPWEEINTKVSQLMDPTNDPAVTESAPRDFYPGDVAKTSETEGPADSITIPNHGYEDGEGPIEVQTTGTQPTGISLSTFYFIQRINDHQFHLNATANDGIPINFTDRGTGVHSIVGYSDDQIAMDGAFFDSDRDTLRRFRYRDGLDANGSPIWAWGILDNIADANTANVQVHRGWIGDAKQWVFRWGAFYTGNYPRYCAIHEQRLWLASTPALPNTIWGSQIGLFTDFGPDVGVDEATDNSRVVTQAAAIDYTLGSGQIDRMAWIAAVRQLIVGTTGAIWPIQATSLLEAISPENINSRPSAVLGSALVKPVRVSDEIVYSSASGHKLLAIGFDFERDAFVPQDLSILASHLTEKPFVQLAYAEEPNSIIWGVRNDGLLVGITYERTQRVLGWHAHTMGGTGAKVRSAAVVKDDSRAYDQLWLVVERTVNGQLRRYVEFLEEPFYTDAALEDAAFLDASPVIYDGIPETNFSGLDHLENEAVYAIADGSWIGPLTVSGGSVTLPYAASKVRVGLNFIAYIHTLPIEETGAPGGTLIGRTKRIVENHLRLHRTNYVQIGKSLETLKTINLRRISDLAELPVPLRTLDVDVHADLGIDTDQSYYVASDKPVPLDVIGLVARVEWSTR